MSGHCLAEALRDRLVIDLVVGGHLASRPWVDTIRCVPAAIPQVSATAVPGRYSAATHDALGYLTKRTSPDNPYLDELGVCAYGPGAAAMLHELAERVDRWGRTRDSIVEVRIEIYPSGQGEVADALMTVDKRHSRVVVRPEPQPGSQLPR